MNNLLPLIRTKKVRAKNILFIAILFFGLLNSLSASTFYWVGGTGHWNNFTAHWATSSGGSSFYTRVPAATDDVVFDNNSFAASGQTVSLNVGTFTCRNMTWTGVSFTPTIATNSASNSTLKIYGSLIADVGMRWQFDGTLSFESTLPGNVITSPSSPDKFKWVVFNGVGGEWTMQNDLSCYSVALKKGVLKTNNFTLNSGTIFKTYSGYKSLSFGTSQLNADTITITAPSTTMDAANSIFNCTTENGEGTVSLASGKTYGTLIFPRGATLFASNCTINKIITENYLELPATSTGNTLKRMICGDGGYMEAFGANNYGYIELTNDCRFYANNTFDTIALKIAATPVISIYFGVNTTQTITGTIFSTSYSCSGTVWIESLSHTAKATLVKTSGAVVCHNLVLQNIIATGGATFTAYDSYLSTTPGTSVTGWTIINPVPKTLYWVGGSGSWSDVTHWSTTSGGPGGACVGSKLDDVIFDANSFTEPGQEVILDVQQTQCNNFLWSGTQYPASFNTNSPFHTLSVYGNFSLDSTVIWNHDSYISFKSSVPGKTIKTAGAKLGSVNMKNALGSWTLQDSLHCRQFFINGGSFYSNNHNIHCDEYFSVWGSDDYGNPAFCKLDLGSSTLSCDWPSDPDHAVPIISDACQLFVDSASFIFNSIKLPSGRNYKNLTLLNGQLNSTNSHFKKLTVLGNAGINGSNTVDTFLLNNPGKVLSLQAGTTQTISNVLSSSTSSCSGYINIVSTTPGTQANLVKTSGTVNCDYLVLQDINASGGAVFNTNNSLAISNVSGWNFGTAVSPKTLYWVNNGGNWTDGNHWSFSSGGAGGACLPTYLDNVIFDNNSFTVANQNVKIDVANVYCNNVIWSGTLYPNSVSTDITSGCFFNVFGNFSIESNVIWNFNGRLSFRSSAMDNTITTNGRNLLSTSLDGTGSWILQDNAQFKYFALNKGTFKSNNKDISCDLFSANIGYTSLYLGTSRISTPGSEVWIPHGINIKDPVGVFDADSSSLVGSYILLPSAKVYNEILFTASSGAGAKETLSSSNSQFNTVTGSLNSEFNGTGNSIKKFTLNGNSTIHGSNSYDSLFLNNPGKTIIFDGASTTTITGNIISTSSCSSGSVTIKGLYIPAHIKKTSGNVVLQALILENINAFGGASFTANNSTALAGVTGWNITSASTPRSLYWVGGSGVWSQSYHWALSTGGIAGNCLPTEIDDVYFDENSFSDVGQSVTIDVNNANCNSMSWINQQYSPTVNSNDNIPYVNIYGNFLMDPTVTWDFTGRLSFKSTTAGKTIAGSNVNLRSVSFDGTGSWTLQNDFACKYLALNKGTLRANNNNIACVHLFQVNSTYAGLYLGTSTVNAPDGISIQASTPAVLDADSSTLVGSVIQLPTGKVFNNIDLIPGTGTMTTYWGDTIPYSGTGSLTSTTCTIKRISTSTNFNYSGAGNIIRKATVTGNCFIIGSNTFDTLLLDNPGDTLKLSSGTTQTITASITNTASCANGVTFVNSASSGTLATISKASGAVTLNGLILKDIKGMGGATFVANNSTAVSGVTGITVNKAPVQAPGAITGSTNVCAYAGTTTNLTYSIDSVSGISSYIWAVPTNATIITGQGTTSISVSYASSFVSGNIGVQSVGTCGGYPATSTSTTLAITKGIPAIPALIAGPTNACLFIGTVGNATYSITPVTGALSYNWVVPAGAAIVTGQGTNAITVSYQSTFVSGNVTVQSVSACGSSLAKTLAIAKTLATTPVLITGAANVCPYMGTASNVTYTIAPVASALSYNWSVPTGATLIAGQGTTSIDVNYSSNFVSGNVSVQSVSGCGSSLAKTLAITKTIPAAPLAITGLANVCAYTGTATNITYSITAVANATSYNWTVPVGATIISGQGTTSININYSSSFVSGSVSVQSVSGCGSSIAKALAITKTIPLTPGTITGPSDACNYISAGTNATYSITTVANAISYNWVVPSGATIISGQGTTSIDVSFSGAFVPGNITVQSVANCGSSVAKTLAITKATPAVPVLITGPSNACTYMGTSTSVVYSIAAVANAISYNWTVPTGAVINSGQGTTSITVLYSGSFLSGNISVQSTGACGSSVARTLAITKTAPLAPALISGITNVGAYTGTATNLTYSITAVANASSYNWLVPTGATIVSGQGTTSISVNYSNSFVPGNLSVQAISGCANSAFKTLAITKSAPAVPTVLTGPTNACPFIGTSVNATYSTTAVATATSYNWTVPAGATIISGQGTISIDVTYSAAFVSGNVSVSAVNAGGTSLAKTRAITKTVPAIPVAITGNANACSYMGTATNVTYSITAVANATSYNWAVPVGATIISGQGTTSINVNYSSSFVSGSVSVQSVSGCGSSVAKTLAITKTIPAAPLAITGLANVCAYTGTATNITYSITAVANATSYNWTVPVGATIISGQGTTSIDVNYSSSFVSGNVSIQSVAGCGSSIAKTLAITKTIPAAPLTITGLANVCAYTGTATNLTYSVTAVAGATSYNWVVPAGATIISGQGTTSIDVNYSSSFVSGNVSVQSVANCGSSIAKALVITRTGPGTPGLVSGLANVCAYTGTSTNLTYTIVPVANATSYNWIVPANVSIISGQGTNSIELNFSSSFVSGNLSVQALSNCASSAVRLFAVAKTTPAIPVLITGPTNACSYMGSEDNATYSVASVANAISYNWTVPAGATIISGQGTTSIDVSYTSSFVSGNVSVQSVANCGSSIAKTLAITKAIPAVPGTISGETEVCAYLTGSSNVVYSIITVANASSYNWSVPAGATIVSGQGTNVIEVAYSTSFTGGNITVTSVSGCGSSAAKTLTIGLAQPPSDTVYGQTDICSLSSTSYLANSSEETNSYNWFLSNGITPEPGTSGTISTNSSTGITTVMGGSSFIDVVFDTTITNNTTSSLGISVTGICGTSSQYNISLMGCIAARQRNPSNHSAELIVKLYPNPTVDLCYIDLYSEMSREVIIETTDVLGNVIIKNKQQVLQGTTTIANNCREIGSGVYIVKITDVLSNKTTTYKMIKQ